MIDSLTRNWWVQLIRGGLALTLGATALVAPGSDTGAGMTLAVFLVAAFAIGDGAMTVTTGLALPGEHRGRGGLIATGAAGGPRDRAGHPPRRRSGIGQYRSPHQWQPGLPGRDCGRGCRRR